MRDPERIEDIVYMLQELWEQDPDLRFFQLIYNLQTFYSRQNNGVGRVEIRESNVESISRVGYDLFAVEDDEALSLLQNYLNFKKKHTTPIS